MNAAARPLHIDRLDLDVRGLPPAVVEAAVRALGPALQAELAQTPSARREPVHGPIRATANTTAPELARLIARQVLSAVPPTTDI